jgi:hypothetical protein
MNIIRPAPMPGPSYEYDFHDLANEYPLIEGDEFDNLVEDIAKRGIRHPIDIFEGRILDGRNRYRAAKVCGHTFGAINFKTFIGTYSEAEEHVASMNGHRRNLDTKQKQALIKRKITRHPDYSDPAIARLVGCDKKTVKGVREKMIEAVETLKIAWAELSPRQREDFVKSLRGEILTALGNSPA